MYMVDSVGPWQEGVRKRNNWGGEEEEKRKGKKETRKRSRGRHHHIFGRLPETMCCMRGQRYQYQGLYVIIQCRRYVIGKMTNLALQCHILFVIIKNGKMANSSNQIISRASYSNLIMNAFFLVFAPVWTDLTDFDLCFEMTQRAEQSSKEWGFLVEQILMLILNGPFCTFPKTHGTRKHVPKP